LEKHEVLSQFKYIKNCMTKLKKRLEKSEIADSNFLDLVFKILVWEPSQRMIPSEALQHPWIVKGLPNEIR
jgi:hypothetical protein